MSVVAVRMSRYASLVRLAPNAVMFQAIRQQRRDVPPELHVMLFFLFFFARVLFSRGYTVTSLRCQRVRRKVQFCRENVVPRWEEGGPVGVGISATARP